jgi:predicted N-acyltransferase
LSALKSLCRPDALCGVHALFVDEAESKLFDREGYFIRTAHQYHWINDGYASFDEFLERFRSKRRREIRRERRVVRDAGYHVEAVHGADLTPDMLDDIVAFYESTCSRYMYGQQYLSREFFEEVAATMPQAIRAFFAINEDGKRVAGTFNLASSSRLYGRYWGYHEDIPHLHFETCYYSMIDVAIAEGFDVIEPGAGGDHKYTRGFTPVTMYSAHELTDPQLRTLLERHVDGERDAVGVMIDEMKERGPLR